LNDDAKDTPDFHARAVKERIELTNEWHARLGLALPPPMRCSHVVSLRSETTLGESRAKFAEFCRKQGQSLPAEGSRQHVVDIGACRLKWEGHTEATSHTILVPGNGHPPFSETALDFLEQEKRAELADDMFIGVHVEVVEGSAADELRGIGLAQSLLGSHQVYGGLMSSGNAAVWSAFQLDAEGFIRILIVDYGLSLGALSRLLQRLLEMETYRMLAMMALPRARAAMVALGSLEPQLIAVMNELENNKSEQYQEQALREITGIAAKVEQIATSHAYRFAAARAYADIVERRASEVGEQVVENNQRYTNFMLRSLLPAMRTCDATELRSNELAQRVSRAANLLNTMVDMVQKKQSQELLLSMAERARLQLRLQQAVEGFSIFAISYYAVGLLSYGLKALVASGVEIDDTLLTGLAAPVIFATVWVMVRIIRRGLSKSEKRVQEHL
jgi:uncharacterized membrane-anchored protein